MSNTYAVEPDERDTGCRGCGKPAGVLSFYRDKFLCGTCWDAALKAEETKGTPIVRDEEGRGLQCGLCQEFAVAGSMRPFGTLLLCKQHKREFKPPFLVPEASPPPSTQEGP